MRYLRNLPECPTRKGGDEWLPGAKRRQSDLFWLLKPRLERRGSLLLILVLAFSFATLPSIPTSSAKEIRPFKNQFGKESHAGFHSCQTILEILKGQKGNTVTIFLKSSDVVFAGVVVSTDYGIVRVDDPTLPAKELIIPVCSIGALLIPR